MFNSSVSLPEGKCDEHVIETESAPDVPKVDMSRTGFPRCATSNTRWSSSRNPVDEKKSCACPAKQPEQPQGQRSRWSRELLFLLYMLHDEQNEPCHSPQHWPWPFIPISERHFLSPTTHGRIVMVGLIPRVNPIYVTPPVNYNTDPVR